MARPPGEGMVVVVQGLERMKVLEYLANEPYPLARVQQNPATVGRYP